MNKKKPIKVILQKSKKKDKKFVAIMPEFGHKHNFGQAGASDFTINKDPKRKERYIERHKKRENWNDIHSAGFWSKHLLWNKDTINKSIKDIEKKYNLDITKKSSK
tara:strand:+ start:237 stop:554 length:318 start_codon:yes stop_codon:yes gene_type:complete